MEDLVPTQTAISDDTRVHLADFQRWLYDTNIPFSEASDGIFYCADKKVLDKVGDLVNSIGITKHKGIGIIRLSGQRSIVYDETPSKVTLFTLKEQGDLMIGQSSLYDKQTVLEAKFVVRGKGDFLLIKHD